MNPPVFDDDWPEEVKSIYEHDRREIWDATIAPHIWNQYHNQLDRYFEVAGVGTKLDIMDVGCAQATLALKLSEAGHKVVALDLRKDFLDYAKLRYEFGDISFLQGNVLDMDIDHTFDLIFANQIIEHLVYPGTLVSQLKKMLKPDGRLVITTPNCDYLKNNLPNYTALGNLSHWEDKQFTADGDGHFFAYRDEELRIIIEKSGMRVTEILFFETPWVSGHMKFRFVNRFIPYTVLKSMENTMLKIPILNRRLSHQLMIISTPVGDQT